VLPLTNDKAELKQRIEKLKISGATAGQLGTAWAWYLLSPNWSSYFPTTARPGAYGDPKTQKIAVLMTDGEYNTQFWNGVWDNNSNTKHASAAAPNGGSKSQAETFCTNMKAKGIEVFTVGFQVNTNARNLLRACATDAAHYYDATSGQALRMAFRDIALRISSIRLNE
jgi:von Willebrand factor type A domain